MSGTAYNSYLRTDVLHSLQEQVTETEGERSFLVVCQVQELYFALVSHEVACATDHLRNDRARSAVEALNRAASHFVGLNASWRSLSWMLPSDFQQIKIGMTAVHGKSSSLQSWKYREMLFRLGLRDEDLADVVASMPAQQAELQSALASPSVYGEALQLARRLQHLRPNEASSPTSVPDASLDQSVVAFWTEVLISDDPGLSGFYALAHALIAVAEGLAEYKHLHFLTTARTLGARPAYFGTSGTDWLLKGLHDMPFPELWATRVRAELP